MTNIKENNCLYNLVCASTILKINKHKEGVHFQNVEEFNILHSRRYMRFALSCTLESCSNWYQQQPASVDSKSLHTEVELEMGVQGRSRLSPYSCACTSHFRDPFWIHSTIAAPAHSFFIYFISTVVSAALNMFCLNSHWISMGSSVSSHWERRERESSKVVRNLLPNTDGILIALSAYLCLSVKLWMLWTCVWRISNTLRSFTQRRISMWVLIFTTLVSFEKQIWLFRVYLCKMCICVNALIRREKFRRRTGRLQNYTAACF